LIAKVNIQCGQAVVRYGPKADIRRFLLIVGWNRAALIEALHPPVRAPRSVATGRVLRFHYFVTLVFCALTGLHVSALLAGRPRCLRPTPAMPEIIIVGSCPAIVVVLLNGGLAFLNCECLAFKWNDANQQHCGERDPLSQSEHDAISRSTLTQSNSLLRVDV
jgi:hypothetical protein